MSKQQIGHPSMMPEYKFIIFVQSFILLFEILYLTDIKKRPLHVSCILSTILVVTSFATDCYLPDTQQTKLIQNILTGVCGTSIFWTLLGCISLFLHKDRMQFTDFLGASTHHTVKILLSNARSSTNGKEVEEAIGSGTEFEIVNMINKFVYEHENNWFDIVNGLMDSLWKNSLPKFILSFSPETYTYVDVDSMLRQHKNGPLIIVGSTNKNTLRRNLLHNNSLSMIFQWESCDEIAPTDFSEERKLLVNNADIFNCISCRPTKNKINCQEFSFFNKYNISIIEKITTIAGSTIFCCAGVRADDSYYAVSYLFSKWETLPRSDNFALCIGTKFSENILGWESPREGIALISIYDGMIQYDTGISSTHRINYDVLQNGSH